MIQILKVELFKIINYCTKIKNPLQNYQSVKLNSKKTACKKLLII